MNLNLQGFTKTQMEILRLLSDGEPHHRDKVVGCLPDELSTNIQKHLTAMRKLLRPQGQTILCVVKHRQYHYCWVQLCPPAYQAMFQGRQDSVGPCVF